MTNAGDSIVSENELLLKKMHAEDELLNANKRLSLMMVEKIEDFTNEVADGVIYEITEDSTIDKSDAKIVRNPSK